MQKTRRQTSAPAHTTTHTDDEPQLIKSRHAPELVAFAQRLVDYVDKGTLKEMLEAGTSKMREMIGSHRAINDVSEFERRTALIQAKKQMLAMVYVSSPDLINDAAIATIRKEVCSEDLWQSRVDSTPATHKEKPTRASNAALKSHQAPNVHSTAYANEPKDSGALKSMHKTNDGASRRGF